MEAGNQNHPTREEMKAVFAMCRHDQWNSVLNSIRSNPLISTTSMIMDNHITTTILHQAITSKGDTKARARVILEILNTSPSAAGIKNGYGSLALHVLCQRNTKMDSKTKERLMRALVEAYKPALVLEGGVGKRTPLHIIFTDYVSPGITKMMIENGRQACFKKDKKGFLPAHVACMRHCSPQKLSMLLQANPRALTAKTNDGATLLSLAVDNATSSHPNYALIEEIKRYLQEYEENRGLLQGPQNGLAVPSRVSSDDTSMTAPVQRVAAAAVTPTSSNKKRANSGSSSSNSSSRRRTLRNRKRKVNYLEEEDGDVGEEEEQEQEGQRLRQAVGETPAAADLLLHFSRQGIDEDEIKFFATV